MTPNQVRQQAAPPAALYGSKEIRNGPFLPLPLSSVAAVQRSHSCHSCLALNSASLAQYHAIHHECLTLLFIGLVCCLPFHVLSQGQCGRRRPASRLGIAGRPPFLDAERHAVDGRQDGISHSEWSCPRSVGDAIHIHRAEGLRQFPRYRRYTHLSIREVSVRMRFACRQKPASKTRK